MGDYADWSESEVIRQWWYAYHEAIRTGAWLHEGELGALTQEAARRGIVKGSRMPRTGAEDLAQRCDRARGRP